MIAEITNMWWLALGWCSGSILIGVILSTILIIDRKIQARRLTEENQDG